jgi:hypothetical protein
VGCPDLGENGTILINTTSFLSNTLFFLSPSEERLLLPGGLLKRGFFGFSLLFLYDIQHCFICRPSDYTVSEDAGIEPRTVATTALAVRRFIHLAIDLIHTQLHCLKNGPHFTFYTAEATNAILYRA